jgi:CheY-like chemotaxis protein
MREKLRVAILDDHPAIVEGYKHYLSREPDIRVVASATLGEELEPMLAEHFPIHVLVLHINVPTSSSNLSPYPVFYLIPKLIQQYPGLKILIISMYKQSSVIRAAIEAGASGFVLKDDRDALETLGSVAEFILAVRHTKCFFSRVHCSRPDRRRCYRCVLPTLMNQPARLRASWAWRKRRCVTSSPIPIAVWGCGAARQPLRVPKNWG